MSTKQDIGKVLKGKLGELNTSPDLDVWDTLQTELKKQKKKKQYRKGAIILLILASLFCLYKFTYEKKETSLTHNVENKNSLLSKKICDISKTENSSIIGDTLLTETTSEYKTQNEISSIKTQKKNTEERFVNRFNTQRKQANFIYLESKKRYLFNIPPALNDTLAIKNNLEEEEVKDSLSRWSVSVTGGINFLNTSLKENIVNDTIKKEKSNSVTESYGVRVNYRLNKNTTLRFGIQKLSMRFNTKNIGNSNPNLRIDSISNITNISPLISNEDLKNRLNNSSTFNIKEETSYLEMPFEIQYKLPKVKNLSLIGGASYLHLLNSNIYVGSDNIKKFKIGKSLDAKTNAFSLNLGLSYDIKLSKRIYLNFEGYYKQYFGLYQSNGINLNSQNFNFQTGFTYKF
ncbi:outer membrane beta-barrel protein [uncultured Tenacibaculum sp.]|uniref:outer membrane beta-barrel protein n=1 Tax=uncultured Tenacibaculum sp. TaxID=174713 RepID=UPI002635A341|nr:outer membrane beta-barrel protein [uncultured Tenacibaculum sp.]